MSALAAVTVMQPTVASVQSVDTLAGSIGNRGAGAPPSVAVAAPTAPTPDPAAVARFDRAMTADRVGGVNNVNNVNNVGNVGNVGGIGQALPVIANATATAHALAVAPLDASMPTGAPDRILASLRTFAVDAGNTWSAMSRFASVSTPHTMSELMRVQIGAMQASVQFEYIGKIISKSTQNIDSLIKTQ